MGFFYEIVGGFLPQMVAATSQFGATGIISIENVLKRLGIATGLKSSSGRGLHNSFEDSMSKGNKEAIDKKMLSR